MNHRYQPQTTAISKTVYSIFLLGIVLGTGLGYGIRDAMGPDEAVPTEEQVAVVPGEETTPPVVEGPGSENTAPEAVEVTPDPEPALPEPEPMAARFDADVSGRWPARHVFVGIEGTKASLETLEWLNEFKPGGIVLGPRNVADPLQLGALVLQLKEAVGLGTTLSDPPLIVFHDDTRAVPALATVLEMAGEGDLADPVAAARQQARAARKHGIGVFIAPSLDLYVPNVSAPLLGQTTLGSQPDVVTRLGLSYTDQFRGGGVIPVAGHFPGAGLAIVDDSGQWYIPANQMDGLAAGLQPFQDAIEAGIPGILVGHMAVPGIELDDPKRPASSSPKLLKIVLREKLGFTGVILSDDLGSLPVSDEHPLERIAVTTLGSGCDVVLLKEANREKLAAICKALVRVSEQSGFPSDQLKSSQARLDAWQAQLAKSPAPVAPPVVQVAENREVPAPTEPTPPADAVKVDPKPVEKTEEPAEETKVDDEAGTDTAKGSTTDVKPPAEEMVKTPVTLPITVEVPAETDGGSTEEPATEDTTPPADKTETATTEDVKSDDVKAETEMATPEVEADAKPKPDAEEKAPEEVTVVKPEKAEEEAPEVAGPFREHRIEKGDSLLALSKRYNVSVADLMKWNNLDSQVIKYGFKLKVGPEAKEDGATEGEASAAEKKAEAEAPAEEVTEESPSPEEDSAAMAADNPEPADEGEGKEDVPAPEAEPITGSDPEETPEPAEPVPSPEKAPQPPDTDMRAHRVVAEDTVPSVANQYGVQASDVVAWNGLVGVDAPLESGSTLTIYLPMAAAPEEKAETVEAPAPGTYEIHVVSPGDNLRRIAQKYGVTQQAIVELNKLKSPDHVQLGWKLKIPKK